MEATTDRSSLVSYQPKAAPSNVNQRGIPANASSRLDLATRLGMYGVDWSMVNGPNANYRGIPANASRRPDPATRSRLGRSGIDWHRVRGLFFSITLITLCVVVISLLFFLAYKYEPDPTEEPWCSVKNIYFPALDKSLDDTHVINNTAISFHLTITNTISGKHVTWIHYDTMNMTVYYGGNNSVLLIIGNTSIPKFDLGYWSFKRSVTVETFGVPWEDAQMVVSEGETAVFRIQLDATFHYTRYFSTPKTYAMQLGATVNVNSHGKSVKESYRLSDAASVHVIDCIRVSAVGLLLFLLLVLH